MLQQDEGEYKESDHGDRELCTPQQSPESEMEVDYKYDNNAVDLEDAPKYNTWENKRLLRQMAEFGKLKDKYESSLVR